MSDRVRFFGSIKLAVPLLAIITTVLIWATFYEAQVGSAVVGREIYRSHWFGVLMFLLAVNLGASALSRFPWRGARKVGFALTHLGLIVIIAGSAAVIHLGVEGMLLVRTDSGANDQIRIEGELLEVLTADGLQQADVFVRDNGTVSPAEFAGLSLVGYSENTVETASFTEGAAVPNPAVRLSLKSDRMGQTLERWLAVAPIPYSKVPVGPAVLEIIQSDPAQLNQLLAPIENEHPWGTLAIAANGAQIEIDVQENLSRSLPISDELNVKVSNFWADFRLDGNNRPTSASPQLNNPAVQLEVVSPQGSERWFVFSQGFPPIRKPIAGKVTDIEISYTSPPQQSEDYFRVLVTPANELFYAAQSSTGFQSGPLKLGESVSPGWADFQIAVEEFVAQAQIQRQVVPVGASIEGIPALQIRTEEGEAWLPWGSPTAIDKASGEIYAAFGPKVMPLPFAVKLEDFIVERNEGSESVAMWTSQIRIEDREREVVTRRSVWMNHPTWYRGWKIAQASWNPGDLRQSTLQVKREPLWVTALTWFGSALVVLGIATMFYGRAIAKQLRRPSQTTSEVSAPFSAVSQ